MRFECILRILQLNIHRLTCTVSTIVLFELWMSTKNLWTGNIEFYGCFQMEDPMGI